MMCEVACYDTTLMYRVIHCGCIVMPAICTLKVKPVTQYPNFKTRSVRKYVQIQFRKPCTFCNNTLKFNALINDTSVTK